MVPEHFNQPVKLTEQDAIKELDKPHWTYKYSPLALPDILKKQLGVTRYKEL